jgi:hypothetical protein
MASIAFITTKHAAMALGISETRVCFLLRKGRIPGAIKQGRVWMIPAKNGQIEISDGKRGPDGSWTREYSTDKKKIHVYRQRILSNRHTTDKKPPIIIKNVRKKNLYTFFAEISGPFNIIYDPEHPLDGDAEVWIETYGRVITDNKCR